MSDKFSYSRVDTFVQCGFKYKLRYVDKHYLYSDSIATEVGTLIHGTEEAIANAIKNNEAIPYIQLKNNIILKMCTLTHKYKDVFNEPDKAGRTYTEKINEYLKTGIYRLEQFIKLHTGYQIVAAEQYFEFDFRGTVFKGFIDRIIFDSVANKYIVQDIKTYAQPLEHDDLDPLPLQFVVYSLAMQKLFGVEPHRVSCQYDLPFCNIVQTAGTTGLSVQDTNGLKLLLDRIYAQDFEPHPSALCHWCEFCPTNPNQPEEGKNLCPYYMLWTKDNKTKKVANKWKGLDQHEAIMKKYLLEQQQNE